MKKKPTEAEVASRKRIETEMFKYGKHPNQAAPQKALQTFTDNDQIRLDRAVAKREMRAEKRKELK